VKYVLIALTRTHLEERIIRTLELLEYFVDDVVPLYADERPAISIPVLLAREGDDEFNVARSRSPCAAIQKGRVDSEGYL
jgi:hypothetical protein